MLLDLAILTDTVHHCKFNRPIWDCGSFQKEMVWNCNLADVETLNHTISAARQSSQSNNYPDTVNRCVCQASCLSGLLYVLAADGQETQMFKADAALWQKNRLFSQGLLPDETRKLPEA